MKKPVINPLTEAPNNVKYATSISFDALYDRAKQPHSKTIASASLNLVICKNSPGFISLQTEIFQDEEYCADYIPHVPKRLIKSETLFFPLATDAQLAMQQALSEYKRAQLILLKIAASLIKNGFEITDGDLSVEDKCRLFNFLT